MWEMRPANGKAASSSGIARLAAMARYRGRRLSVAHARQLSGMAQNGLAPYGVKPDHHRQRMPLGRFRTTRSSAVFLSTLRFAVKERLGP
jgi:hypothetical protein